MKISLAILAIIPTIATTVRAQTPTSTTSEFPLHKSGVPKSFWRLPCRGQSGIGRVDPLMDPGVPGAHVHTIAGGNGFGLNTTFETLNHSTCTSCAVKQDKSAYWTPTLHFMYANGTAVMVEQIGGMLAYYKAFSGTRAFPEGFRMITGNPYVRNFSGPFPDDPQSDATVWKDTPDDVAIPEQQFFLMQRALGFNCLNYYGGAPEGSLYRHQLPTKDYMDTHCVDGLRLELAFPSCGNGSIDSEDHHSHMAYPSLVQQGTCPKGYDVKYPLLFYETIYNTWAFAGIEGQFLLSYGDPIGTGYHGDFMMGWDSEDLLQRAIDTCRSMSGQVKDCPLFDLQSMEDQEKCHFAIPDVLMDDNPTGPRNGLAVDVPIQYGPDQATTYPVAGQPGVPTRHFDLSPPPRTLIGNLSIHPYGAVANPTLIAAASGGGTISMDYSTVVASTPTPNWMAPLSPVTYVSGVIAPEFRKYLTISPSDAIDPSISGHVSPSIPAPLQSNSMRSPPGPNTLSGMASPTACDPSPRRQPISVETSYKTMGNEVVQIFIEDVEFVITTRTTMTITGETSTIQSSATSERPSSPAPAGTSDGKMSHSIEQTDSHDTWFNTIMWISGSKTFYTSPSTIETPGSSPKGLNNGSTAPNGDVGL